MLNTAMSGDSDKWLPTYRTAKLSLPETAIVDLRDSENLLFSHFVGPLAKGKS